MSTTLVERELAVQDYGGELHVQDELTWGLSYREAKVGETPSPMRQKASPINVPFKLCRAAQRRHKKSKKICKCTSQPQNKTPQLTLMGRSVLTQDKYMDMLSIPNQNFSKTNKIKHKTNAVTPCCKCKIEPCPPRLVQMSVPKKRYVLENWKMFENVLPTEVLTRFDQILKSGNNLEPRDARYYFKKLKQKEKKELRKKKKLCKKWKKEKKRGDELWLKLEITELVDAIVNYIKGEPLFMLNFQQMMTSDELLRYLTAQRVISVKSRNTKNAYKKTIIEISDKLIKWMDTMCFFADIQPVDSKEIIIQIPSLESLLEEEIVEEEEEEEEEGEEELEGEEEEIRKKLREEQEMEALFGEEGVLTSDSDQEAFIARKLLDKKDAFLEDEGEGSVYDLLKNLDEDILQKLIQILSATPDDILSEEIDAENLPGVTYADILQKLKEIRDGNLLQQRGDKIFLEERMVEWAKNNDPESIDDKVLDKIHETSTILSEWFRNVGVGDFKDQKPKKQALDTLEEEGSPGGGEIVDEAEPAPVEESFEKSQDTGAVEAARPREADENIIDGIEGIEVDATAAPQEASEEKVQESPETEEEAGIRAEADEAADAAVADTAQPDSAQETTEEGGEDLGAEGATTEADDTPLPDAVEQEIIKDDVVPEINDEPEGAAETEELKGEAPPEGEDELAASSPPGDEFDEGAELHDQTELKEEELVSIGLEGEEFGEFEGEEMFEGEEEMIEGEGMFDVGEGEEEIVGVEEGEGVSPGAAEGEAIVPSVEGEKLVPEEFEKLDRLLGVIPGHKPSVILEHQPGTICCLSLKIWAVWLLEISNNAHNWTRWMNDITKQIRFYVSVIRGDVTLPSGATRVLHKEEWRKFARETEETVISWRQYSQHVKDLSSEIVDNFHGKPVNCCPKCLQDHLIKNVVTAHETFQALTEAINCAGYWQRCLDKILEQTSKISGLDMAEEPEPSDKKSLQSDESYTVEIEEISPVPQPVPSQTSYDSYYEIEELSIPRPPVSHYEIFEIQPQKPQPPILEIEELAVPKTEIKQEPIPAKAPSATAAKPKKSNMKKRK